MRKIALHPDSRTAGFTMIELLVVIAIIGVLLLFLVPRIFTMRTAGERNAQGAEIQQIKTAIEAYRHDPSYGDLPPTSAALAAFAPKNGNLAPNDVNLGIESLVLHFNQKDFHGENPFASMMAAIAKTNTDGDSASVNVTSFGTNELFECPDKWGNPLVYFRLRDFADRKKEQKIRLPDGTDLSVAPMWDDKLNRFAGYEDGFQILSLGPDGKYGTADDVTSWEP
ncbi:MAG: type II secretion system protein [Planctomycetes bacterium]|nr:type II secretion system protein [Planctomycetota bacterium]MBI3846798.1 type II secretion system protein [Planctomycetota bacterium]